MLKRGEKVDLRRKSKEELLRLLREDKRMGEKEKKDVVPLLERIFLMEDLKTKKPIPIIFKSDVIECLKAFVDEINAVFVDDLACEVVGKAEEFFGKIKRYK